MFTQAPALIYCSHQLSLSRIHDPHAALVSCSHQLSLLSFHKLHAVRDISCSPGVLWSVSGQLVVFMFVYAGVGTLVTTSVFGRVLMRLFYNVRPSFWGSIWLVIVVVVVFHSPVLPLCGSVLSVPTLSFRKALAPEKECFANITLLLLLKASQLYCSKLAEIFELLLALTAAGIGRRYALFLSPCT